MSTVTSVTTTLRRRRGLTEEAAVAAVDQACRRLRLPTMRALLGDAVAAANKDQLTYTGFLAELLLAECDDRDRRSTIRRVNGAGFPRSKFLADFDFDANSNINPATIHQLATGEWVRKGQPLCLIGDSGTGKSHLLIGMGTAAAEKGFRVKYTLATRLVNELVEAADEKQLARTIARYGRVDLLCIDELGYMELDRRGAELLFQVLTEREEKNSVAIASNEGFAGWTKTFTDPRLSSVISTSIAGFVVSSGGFCPGHCLRRDKQRLPLVGNSPGGCLVLLACWWMRRYAAWSRFASGAPTADLPVPGRPARTMRPGPGMWVL